MLQVWDVSGQDRFQSIGRSYYRGAHGCVVVFDVTNRNSLEHVTKYVHGISAERAVPVVLVGNKCDLDRRREVSFEDGKKVADELGLLFMEVSAKDPNSVELLFHLMVSLVLAEARRLHYLSPKAHPIV